MPSTPPIDLEALSLNDLQRLIIELLVRVTALEEENRALRRQREGTGDLQRRTSKLESALATARCDQTRARERDVALADRDQAVRARAEVDTGCRQLERERDDARAEVDRLRADAEGRAVAGMRHWPRRRGRSPRWPPRPRRRSGRAGPAGEGGSRALRRLRIANEEDRTNGALAKHPPRVQTCALYHQFFQLQFSTMPIPPEHKTRWSDALELKLRRVSGDAFQNFFSDMMEHRHPDDFVRVKASGPLGDKKCDGLIQSTTEIFQCYGADNGGAKKNSVNAALTTKMVADYKGACGHWAGMTAWYMVHNFVDGVGAAPIATLEELKKSNPHHALSFFGKARFAQVIFELELHQIETLLGKAATEADFLNLQAPEVVAIMDAIMKATSDDLPLDVAITAVPVDKLSFNGLSGAFQRKIVMGRQNEPGVQSLIEEHPNPLFATTVANEFRRRYLDLRYQDLAPNTVMTELYNSLVGAGNVSQERDVAAWSLLAYLFERCTIFEDVPAMVDT